MKIVTTLFLLTALSFAKGYEPFLSFTASKIALSKIYAQHKKLPLSGCNYKFNPYSCPPLSYVDSESCSFFKEDSYSELQWIYLVPEEIFSQSMSCMRQKECISTVSHRAFAGSRCCRAKSAKFRQMSSDMHNIIPVLSERAKMRSERMFVTLPDVALYDKSASIVGDTLGSIVSKGEIARIYLYMSSHYQLELAPYHKALFLKWHHTYAVSAWEREKNRKIYQLQGTFNPYIEKL